MTHTHPTAASGPHALTVSGLVRTYGTGAGAVRALDGLHLDVPRGSFTAVMGPSGSGKSTFLSCAAGLDVPDEGRVILDGDDLTGWSEQRLAEFRREHVGFVFQSFHLLPYLSAEQNVALPLRLAGRRVDRTHVRDLLARVGLGERRDHLPTALSGGQEQRVAIARALVTRPAVVVADEPTGSLDTTTAHGVLELLRSCCDDLGQTVVMVTHDPVAASYADEVVFLVDGRVAGRMHSPTADAVAGQLAHLDDLVGVR
ncbi:ABC transporter ATP-binding protein [Nocardioides sp. GXZ039]|uniref:ABC transporter ATP-binding protein n=1 Tax=Nocardioides sp. GXZ039 TaxID=3136018 RepID=UPI0030F41E93